jgi:co-chaperonin GroES (HSP10)
MIQCINRWLVIKPNPKEEKIGSILLPETSKERNTKARVIEVADFWTDNSGKTHQSLICKGQEVMYNHKRAIPIIDRELLEGYSIGEGEELCFITFEDVYFITQQTKEGEQKHEQYLQSNKI